MQQINDLLCTPLFSIIVFGSFILTFCPYSHKSGNFVIGILRMRLNEGSVQFPSSGHEKSLTNLSLGSSYIGAWADFH